MSCSLKTSILSLLVVVLAACASSSPDVIRRDDAQRLSLVEDAVVVLVREVKVESGQTGQFDRFPPSPHAPKPPRRLLQGTSAGRHHGESHQDCWRPPAVLM